MATQRNFRVKYFQTSTARVETTTATLTSDVAAFVLPKGASTATPTAGCTLTAAPGSFSTPTYAWYTVTSGVETLLSGQTAATLAVTASAFQTLVGSGTSGTYRVKISQTGFTTRILDYTIYYLREGADGTAGAAGISVALGNDSVILPSASDGTVSSYSNSSTTIRVYEGATELTYDGVGISAGKYTVSVSGSSVTPGSVTLTTAYATLGVASAASADNSSITITVTGKNSAGASFSQSKVQKLTKVRTTVVYDIIPSSAVLTKDAVDAATTGTYSSITIQGKKFDGTTTSNYGWLTVTANGGSEATTATDTSSAPVTLSPTTTAASSSYTVKMYNQATVSGATLLDTQVIPVVFKGATGAAGSNATAYWLVTSASVINQNISNVFTPTSITVTAMSQVGTATAAATNSRFKIYENGSGTASYTSSADETTKTYTPSGTSVTSIKVEMYAAGGTVTKLDEETIPIVKDGSSIITANLSNEAVVLSAGSTGTVASYTNSGTTIQVFEGGTALTYLTTLGSTASAFTISATTLSPTASITVGSVSGNATTTAAVAAHSAMTQDTVAITYTITYNKANGTSGTLNVVQSLAKSKAGTNGTNGTNGTDGNKTITTSAYLWATATPTINSTAATYTWATNVITPYPTSGSGTSTVTWTVAPSAAPGSGYVLYQANLLITATASASTSSVNWNTATLGSIGYRTDGSIGPQGDGARIAYAKATSGTSFSGTATSTGSTSFPSTGTEFGISGLTWQASPPTIAAGESLFQTDGIYVVGTNTITWQTPYLSNLKVGSLSAISANMGTLNAGIIRTDGGTSGTSNVIILDATSGTKGIFAYNSGGTKTVQVLTDGSGYFGGASGIVWDTAGNLTVGGTLTAYGAVRASNLVTGDMTNLIGNSQFGSYIGAVDVETFSTSTLEWTNLDTGNGSITAYDSHTTSPISTVGQPTRSFLRINHTTTNAQVRVRYSKLFEAKPLDSLLLSASIAWPALASVDTTQTVAISIERYDKGDGTYPRGKKIIQTHSVKAASTANVSISSPPATLDGYTLVAGDTILLKNQTTSSENGIYVWNSTAIPLDRSAGLVFAYQLLDCAIYVVNGTTNAGRFYKPDIGTLATVYGTTSPIVIGTAALTLTQYTLVAGEASGIDWGKVYCRPKVYLHLYSGMVTTTPWFYTEGWKTLAETVVLPSNASRFRLTLESNTTSASKYWDITNIGIKRISGAEVSRTTSGTLNLKSSLLVNEQDSNVIELYRSNSLVARIGARDNAEAYGADGIYATSTHYPWGVVNSAAIKTYASVGFSSNSWGVYSAVSGRGKQSSTSSELSAALVVIEPGNNVVAARFIGAQATTATGDYTVTTSIGGRTSSNNHEYGFKSVKVGGSSLTNTATTNALYSKVIIQSDPAATTTEAGADLIIANSVTPVIKLWKTTTDGGTISRALAIIMDVDKLTMYSDEAGAPELFGLNMTSTNKEMRLGTSIIAAGATYTASFGLLPAAFAANKACTWMPFIANGDGGATYYIPVWKP